MKKRTLLLFTAAVPFLTHAQVALYISPSTSLTINPATIFSAGGLTIVPSATYSLSNVSLSRNASLTHGSANPAIARSYSFNNTTPAFNGFVQVSYLPSELNGLTEIFLTPNVNNGTGWQAFPSAATDIINHSVTSTIFSIGSLSEVTLAGISTPLPMAWGNISAIRVSH